MTKPFSKGDKEIAEDPGEASRGERKDLVIKVHVSAAEKFEIDRQKGRLTFSAFLRDRGLNQGKVYDPTYAAIGGVYQSARNVRDSAASIEEASLVLQNSAAVLTGLIGQTAGAERAERAAGNLWAIAEKLHSQSKQLERQSKELGEQASKLAAKHMEEMLKRYPATPIEPRKKR
ncbi:MAG: hypothetical protein V2I43_11830 [Parvularcula sp.]|jgi:hypothetical protein|nr:hypothetical protein [Parvularcula sp.]